MNGQPFEPAAATPLAQSNALLGLPPDARLLIVNNDDFGMYHAINVAVVETIEEGIASSCSLMVPCPWALHAMHLLRQRPQIPFGIHLTLFCDTTNYRWAPVTRRRKCRRAAAPYAADAALARSTLPRHHDLSGAERPSATPSQLAHGLSRGLGWPRA